MSNKIIAVVVDNRWGEVRFVTCGKQYINKIFKIDRRGKKFELLGVLSEDDYNNLHWPADLSVAQARAVLKLCSE